MVLPCYVGRPLLLKGLKVNWKRKDLDSDSDPESDSESDPESDSKSDPESYSESDSETLVLLYQDGESHAKKQDEDYHGRAQFFTEEIQHGNFSLRLDNLTAQDEGKYKCNVYRHQRRVFSVKRKMALRLLGKSTRLRVYSHNVKFP